MNKTKTIMNKSKSLLSRRFAGIVFATMWMSLAAGAMAMQVAGASPAPPPVNVSPHGNLSAGEKISVGVGPNGYFTPNAGVKILECADPGGLAANLPVDDTKCDGNTVEGGTVLVGPDGSFSDPDYPIYMLPSSLLGEPSDNLPICDQTHYCVLYVGQDQNDFTKPKVFSSPFLVASSSGTTTATTAAGGGEVGSSGTASTTAGPPTSASLAPTTSSSTSGTVAGSGPATSAASTSGALANTGPPAEIVWVAASGTALLLTGALGRRFALRRVR